MSVLGDLGSLVGWERGRVSPGIYFDEEVYRRSRRGCSRRGGCRWGMRIWCGIPVITLLITWARCR